MKEGRVKLTKLYARDLQISDDLLDLIVQAAVDAALEEMLFAGGALNLRLLGREGSEPIAAS